MPDDLPDAQHHAQNDARNEAVRRLLADARETGPMPPEVAARLDEVLADLVRAPAPQDAAHDTGPDTGPERPATVVPLPRRRWPRVVLAAAAVTALAMGGTQLLVRDGQDDMQADGRAEVAEQPTLADAPSPAEREDAGGASDLGRMTEKRSSQVTLPGLDRALRAQEVAPLGRLREVLTGHAFSAQDQSTAATQGYVPLRGTRARLLAGWRCGPLYAVPGGSTYTSVERTGTLVVAHPAANGIRLVEVYHCRGAEPRRSATVVTLPVEE